MAPRPFLQPLRWCVNGRGGRHSRHPDFGAGAPRHPSSLALVRASYCDAGASCRPEPHRGLVAVPLGTSAGADVPSQGPASAVPVPAATVRRGGHRQRASRSAPRHGHREDLASLPRRPRLHQLEASRTETVSARARRPEADAGRTMSHLSPRGDLQPIQPHAP